MPQFLNPGSTDFPRPVDASGARYVRSYLILRVLVGALGVALPFLLILVDGLWLEGNPFPRTSLSAYYYSGARELFVGALSAIGVFLLAYKIAEVSLDNTLSMIAGATVLLVALCPTSRPSPSIGLTPLQSRVGESAVATIHFASAAVFLSSLAALSYCFGTREATRPQRPGKRSPRFWRTYHWACAGIIAAAVIWSAVTAISDWAPSRSLLYGEAVAVWAFGASWLWKGLELDMLRHGAAAVDQQARLEEPLRA